jgi:hypothetical protein
MSSSRHTRYAVGSVATSSTGIMLVAAANKDWNTVLGAAGTVAPGLLVFLVGNGGIKGVATRIWAGAPVARRRRASAQAGVTAA